MRIRVRLLVTAVVSQANSEWRKDVVCEGSRNIRTAPVDDFTGDGAAMDGDGDLDFVAGQHRGPRVFMWLDQPDLSNSPGQREPSATNGVAGTGSPIGILSIGVPQAWRVPASRRTLPITRCLKT